MKKLFVERMLRREICRVGKLMYAKGFVAANDGNISVKFGEDAYLFTPTNVSKGDMKPHMIVKTDKEGNVKKGRRKVSSEYKMHLRVYSENSSTGAVVHAHPPAATSFAIAGEPLDKALLTEAVVLLGAVPVAPYGKPGTQEVPDSIAPYCREYNAVMLRNHGVLTWGRDLREAYFRMEAVENFAIISIYSMNIFNGAGRLDKRQVDALLDIRRNLGISSGGRPESK